MLERRSLMSLLVGLTLFVSLWHIMIQQQQLQFVDSTPQFSSTAFVPVNDSTIPTFSSNALSSIISNIQLELLPKKDFSQLIDLNDFEFIINHAPCSDLKHHPSIVILVHSAPGNFKKRQTVRETWGAQDQRALLLFLIGAVANSTSLKDRIDDEQVMYGDLVQGNFIDAYRNMTYKHVMALKWFIYNCPSVRHLLKTDDDVFVNTPLLYSYLEEVPSSIHRQYHHSGLLFCHEIARAKVKRTFRSKWRVSYDEYRDKYFPNHCPGYVILYSSDVALQLYQEAQKRKYFWIDDVHITGTIASNANITITPTNEMFLNKQQQQMLLDGLTTPEELPFIVAQPDLAEWKIRKLWKLVRSSAINSGSIM